MPAEAALSNDAPLLLHSASDGIARLTLNRPRQYNALSSALMSALQQALDGIAADKTVRVVVIEGAGRGFCAGHDLKELRAHPGDRDFRSEEHTSELQSLMRISYAVFCLKKKK